MLINECNLALMFPQTGSLPAANVNVNGCCQTLNLFIPWRTLHSVRRWCFITRREKQ